MAGRCSVATHGDTHRDANKNQAIVRRRRRTREAWLWGRVEGQSGFDALQGVDNLFFAVSFSFHRFWLLFEASQLIIHKLKLAQFPGRASERYNERLRLSSNESADFTPGKTSTIVRTKASGAASSRLFHQTRISPALCRWQGR